MKNVEKRGCLRKESTTTTTTKTPWWKTSTTTTTKTPWWQISTTSPWRRSSTTSKTDDDTKTSKSDEGVTTSQIVGVVVGILLLLACIIAVSVILVMKRQKISKNIPSISSRVAEVRKQFSHKKMSDTGNISPVSFPIKDFSQIMMKLGNRCLSLFRIKTGTYQLLHLSLIHICRCRRIERCRSRWSPYH